MRKIKTDILFDQQVKEARYYAIEIHGSQKYGTFPYIKHLEDVYHILIRFRIEDKTLLIASFLHDAIEDGATSYNKIKIKFGIKVAELVYNVTDELGRNRKERHEKTFPKIKNNIRAIILKLADRIANLEYSKNTKTETSLFDMYKKEYSEFKKELSYKFNFEDTKDLKLQQAVTYMWIYLDSLFL